MKSANKSVLTALLDGDRTITPHQSESVRAILDGKPAPITPLLLRQVDVASMLGCSRQSVWRMVKDGILTPIKIGNGTQKFKRDDILALINGEKVGVA